MQDNGERLMVKAEKVFIMFETEPFPAGNSFRFVKAVNGQKKNRSVNKEDDKPYKQPF